VFITKSFPFLPTQAFLKAPDHGPIESWRKIFFYEYVSSLLVLTGKHKLILMPSAGVSSQPRPVLLLSSSCLHGPKRPRCSMRKSDASQLHACTTSRLMDLMKRKRNPSGSVSRRPSPFTPVSALLDTVASMFPLPVYLPSCPQSSEH